MCYSNVQAHLRTEMRAHAQRSQRGNKVVPMSPKMIPLKTQLRLPNLLFFSPLHRWYGEAGLEQQDLFASLSMANIKMNHPWLYHLHALAVVWVVLVVRHLVFEAQTRFVARRMSWLKSLQYPRANTVLVEEIPKAYRSREKLVKFFNENLGPVASTHLVMQTKRLEQSIELRDFAKSKLAESKASFEKEGVRPSLAKFQPFPLNFFLADTDAIEHFSEELVKYELQIKEMRDALSESRGTSTNSTHSAFVTFGSRKSAEMAKALEFSADSDWLISDAPEAEAIRWQDLAREEALSPNLVILGYVLMLLLFANFSPICLAISSTATEIHLGSLQPIWVALAPTLGLTIFLAMLPTVSRCDQNFWQGLLCLYFPPEEVKMIQNEHPFTATRCNQMKAGVSSRYSS